VQRGYRLYSWCVVWWRSVWLFVSSVRSWSSYVCLARLLCVVKVVWRAVWVHCVIAVCNRMWIHTQQSTVSSVCLCYLHLFGAVPPLLCGIEVQRADCATNCRSRVCQRISIGWSCLSIATPVLCYFSAGNAWMIVLYLLYIVYSMSLLVSCVGLHISVFSLTWVNCISYLSIYCIIRYGCMQMLL